MWQGPIAGGECEKGVAAVVSARDEPAVYEAGQWEIDIARRELRTGKFPVPVGGRAFEMIVPHDVV